jgi:hypothetical protein
LPTTAVPTSLVLMTSVVCYCDIDIIVSSFVFTDNNYISIVRMSASADAKPIIKATDM